MEKTFKIYWLTGKTEIVTGLDITDACNKAGIGAGAVKAIDWYEEIEEDKKEEKECDCHKCNCHN